jgi:type II secretory pathway pseudopilin PulG
MRLQKEEQGYALILVLVLIVLLGIFIPSIMSNLFGSNSQMKMTEKNIQLENLHNMGTTYMGEAIDEAAKVAKETVEEWIGKQTTNSDESKVVEMFYSNFSKVLNEFIPNEGTVKMKDSKQRYKIVIKAIEPPSTSSPIIIKYRIDTSLDETNWKISSIEEKKTVEIKFNTMK